jgi:DNA-binding NarL/FixJ family response regulator
MRDAAAPPTPDLPPSASDGESSAPTGVLLAIEDTFARLGLRFFLHTVCDERVCAEATSVADALLAFQRHRPAIVVLDTLLEGGQGFGLISEFKNADRPPRVIVFTSDELLNSVQRAMMAGAVAYVTTRDSDDVFASAVRRASATNPIISPRLSSLMAARVASGGIEMTQSAATILSQRELDVFKMLGSGSSVKDIALALSMAAKTVETYQGRIKEKLGLKSAAELRSSAIAFVKGA